MKSLINKNKKHWKIYLSILIFSFVLSAIVFINYTFELKNINIDFLNSVGANGNAAEQVENQNIQQLLLQEINNNAGSFLEFVFLDNNLVTKLVRDEFQTVNRVDFSRRVYFNNLNDFGVGLYAVVIKNSEYFVGCVKDSSRENFLVWSMQGNSDGEFYKEVNAEKCETSDLLKLTLHPKALFSKENQEKIDGADSLSGMRIYRSKDFEVLKIVISYLQKNSFDIKGIFIDEIKLVDIDLGSYVLKINLDKDPKLTIADFETISRAGKLQKYINDDKDALDYVDLTFKNKVFFKLKEDKKIEEENGIIASTTKQDAKELLD